jgi:uncharacterized protein YjbJ (UPF0337 family)
VCQAGVGARLPAQSRLPPSSRWKRRIEEGGDEMGDRKQRAKGAAEEIKGKAKAKAGYDTGRPSTEAKGVADIAKGKARRTAGKASSEVKKRTR